MTNGRAEYAVERKHRVKKDTQNDGPGKKHISIYSPKPVDTRLVKLQNGQKLFYEHGGEIKEGIVFKISQDTFWFMTEGEKRELDYAVVGHQLFFTRKGASMKNHK